MDKPAEDALKLFVGQVPREWAAEDLKPIMSEAGQVYEVNIVRDRETRESKGCAFVIYMTRAEADNAIKLFHCNKTLPGAKGPMQVKYADGQQEKIDNKLFVGMLPKTVTAEELRKIFEPYGTIADLNVLRGPAHATKGSAFVKFDSHSAALAAINGLNGKHRMEGSPNMIVVKWADSDKEKSLRKAQKTAVAAAAIGVLPQFPGAPGAPTYMLPQHAAGIYGTPMTYPGFDMQNQAMTAGIYQHQSQMSTAGPTPGAESLYNPALAAFSSAFPGGALPGMPGATGHIMPGMDPAGSNAAAVAAAIREKLVQKEGPMGANLFIYNIPAEWRDNDLATAFAEFGNVLSSKVFIDKLTGVSKNFGFVSYDSAEAAQAAIAIMDGFVVAGRKLKVSLKKGNQAVGTQPAGGVVGAPPVGVSPY